MPELNQHLQTMEQWVKHTIKKYPECADNYKWLIHRVKQEMGFKVYVDYTEIDKMPSEETITRSFRKLVEKGIVKPSKDTQEMRNEREQGMREYYSG